MAVDLEKREVESRDGTRIAYATTRDRSLPTVVLANGLGGNWLSFRPLLEAFGDRCRFVTWDYRGLYASARPKRDDARAYAVERHVEDLAAVLEAEGVTRASLLGWSMGVQVVLEAFAAMPKLAANLILMNGNAGRPFDHFSPFARVNALVPSTIGLASRAHAIATAVTRAGTKLSATRTLLKSLGLVGASLEDATFAELAGALGELDMQPFFRNLLALGEHDATRVLPKVDVPALVIAGARDRLVPRAAMSRVARALPNAEVLVVRGGTHYAAVEYPELVALRIERFYTDHGFLQP